MFFDDRLATVLRHRAASEVGMRTQYRQLLDILGNRKFSPGDERGHSLLAAAWLRLGALSETIPSADRAAMIREPGWRFRSPDLAAYLADGEPEVVSAALNRAQLSAEDWSALIPRLPVRARGFLRLRRDLPVDVEKLLERLGVYDRGLPSPESPPEPSEPEAEFDDSDAFELTEEAPPVAEQEPAAPPQVEPEVPLPDPVDPGRSEISALVERIAQFKRTREAGGVDLDQSPRLPLGEQPLPRERRISAFGFSADAGGRIEWTEASVAPMVIGTRLVRPPVLGASGGATPLERAFARRQPIVEALAELQGASVIAGEWVVDAQPRFTDDGNFQGYVGRFRRQAEPDASSQSPARREADRIRQLLHELRTPVTAVQGYAEVIQQQLFGPAPHEYRALAAAIAADAAHILAGFEELDRLAKLETGAIDIEQGETDLRDLALRTGAQLAQVLGSRMAGIEFTIMPDDPVMIGVDPDDAEALIWRLLATLGGGSASGEMLTAQLSSDGTNAQLICEMPAQLMAEENVFAAEAKPKVSILNAGLFGAGFALRLARAEARAAGGALTVSDDAVTLTLPLLTGTKAVPSPRQRDEAGNKA